MMRDAWDLFEAALAETGNRRRDALYDVVKAAHEARDTSESDRVELLAAAQSELAACGALSLDEACGAVSKAEASGKAGWPNYYLAEAASQLGRPDIVIQRLARIPSGFFDVRDLSWRAARCVELKAMAYIELRDWAGAEPLVDELAAAYALRGDEDDLAPPRDLVMKLLSTMPDGSRLLETLAASLDLAQWVGPDLATRVHAAVAQRRSGSN